MGFRHSNNIFVTIQIAGLREAPNAATAAVGPYHAAMKATALCQNYIDMLVALAVKPFIGHRCNNEQKTYHNSRYSEES